MKRQRTWAAIAAATLLNLPMGSLYAFSVLLKPLEQALGATRSELAFVFGTATICFTLGMNAAPRLFGVASAPVLVGICALFCTAGVALAATATSVVMLGLGYGVLFGIAGGAAYIFVQQGINLMISSRQGLVNGYVISLYPAGAVLAAPAFGLGIEHLGVHGTIAGLAVAVGLTGLGTTLLVIYAGLRLPAAGTPPPVATVPGRPWLLWQLGTVFFLAAAAGLMVLSQAAGIIAAYGGQRDAALIATTAIPAAIAAARVSGGWLVDRFPIPVVAAAAQALALAGTILLTLWPAPATAPLTLAMIGVGYGFISGVSAGAIAFYWPGNAYGRIAARLYIAWCAAAISLPVLAGHLFDLTGGYRLAVIIAGCGNVLGIVLAALLPRSAAPATGRGDDSRAAAS